jgi:hypothetical protein
MLAIEKYLSTAPVINRPLIDWNRATYIDKEGMMPQLSSVILFNRLCLFINRPEAVYDLFSVNSKYVNKHPITGKILNRPLGHSLIFAKTD